MNQKRTYMARVIYNTPRDQLYERLERAPLTDLEKEFVLDTIQKVPVKELADKYNKSPSRISHWKTEIYEHLFVFEMEYYARR